MSSKQSKTGKLRSMLNSEVIGAFPGTKTMRGCLVFQSSQVPQIRDGYYIVPKQGKPLRIFKKEIRDITEGHSLVINPRWEVKKSERYGVAQEHIEEFYSETRRGA